MLKFSNADGDAFVLECDNAGRPGVCFIRSYTWPPSGVFMSPAASRKLGEALLKIAGEVTDNPMTKIEEM